MKEGNRKRRWGDKKSERDRLNRKLSPLCGSQQCVVSPLHLVFLVVFLPLPKGIEFKGLIFN